MQTTISSKFQVVIPRAIREAAGLRVREKLEIFEKGGIIYLVPLQSLDEMRGIAGSIDISELREKIERPG